MAWDGGPLGLAAKIAGSFRRGQAPGDRALGNGSQWRDTRVDDPEASGETGQPYNGKKPGDDGYHDPNMAPPAGFNSWSEVSAHNMSVIDAAAKRQKELEAQGYRYNSSDGTWVGPDGDVTTLSGGGGESGGGGGFQRPGGQGLSGWGR